MRLIDADQTHLNPLPFYYDLVQSPLHHGHYGSRLYGLMWYGNTLLPVLGGGIDYP